MYLRLLIIFFIISMSYVESASSFNSLPRSFIVNQTLDEKFITPLMTNSKDESLSKRKFISDKVNVTLSCEKNETIVNLNFTRPFRGVIQSGHNHSSCRIKGDGRKVYSLQVPHNNCGTKHVVSTGSFFNTIFIRYHPSLEMEGDILKTIVCKFGTDSLFVG